MKILSTRPLTNIKPLLAAASADAVADFHFRTSREVASFLYQYKIGLGKYRKLEPAASIDSQVIALNAKLYTLLEQEKTLNAIAGILDTSFRQDSVALFQLLNPIIVTVDSAITKILDIMSAIAKHKAPRAFSLLAKQLLKGVSDCLNGSYTNILPHWFLANTADSTQFSYMLEIIELDNVGYVYPHYFILLTGKIQGKRLTLWLNSFHEFTFPATAPLGEKVRALELQRSLVTLLQEDGIKCQAHTRALPL